MRHLFFFNLFLFIYIIYICKETSIVMIFHHSYTSTVDHAFLRTIVISFTFFYTKFKYIDRE